MWHYGRYLPAWHISELPQSLWVTNEQWQKCNFQCCEIDGRKKIKGENVKKSAGKGNSNKLKKVLAHQSCPPTVGGDISLVHFVNREIVCSESGRVLVTRKNRDIPRMRKPAKTRKRAQSFFIWSFLISPTGNYGHCSYRRDERRWVSLFHFKSLSIIQPSLFTPCLCGIASPRIFLPVQGPRRLSFIPLSTSQVADTFEGKSRP